MFGSRHWNPYGRLFFSPDGEGGGGTGGDETPPEGTPPEGGEPKPPAVTFDASQEAEVNRRIAAARKQAEAEAKRKVETEAEAKRKAEEEERQRQAQIAAGEFDKVKADYEATIASLSTESTTAAERITAYEAAITPLVDALKGELPAEALADYPEAADAVTRLGWLQARKTLVSALRPDSLVVVARTPKTPIPEGNGVKITSLVDKRQAGYG